MSVGDQKTFVVRTSVEFLARYRELDARIDQASTWEEVAKRQRRAGDACDASKLHAELMHQMHDLVLNELERHWGPMSLDEDPSRPDFPDNWRTLFTGRLMRIEYREREVFRRD